MWSQTSPICLEGAMPADPRPRPHTLEHERRIVPPIRDRDASAALLRASKGKALETGDVDRWHPGNRGPPSLAQPILATDVS